MRLWGYYRSPGPVILRTLKFTVISRYHYLVYCVCHKGTISSCAMLWIFLSPEISTLLNQLCSDRFSFSFPCLLFLHGFNQVVLQNSCYDIYEIATSTIFFFFFQIENSLCMHNNKYLTILTSWGITSVRVKYIGSQWDNSSKKTPLCLVQNYIDLWNVSCAMLALKTLK